MALIDIDLFKFRVNCPNVVATSFHVIQDPQMSSFQKYAELIAELNFVSARLFFS